MGRFRTIEFVEAVHFFFALKVSDLFEAFSPSTSLASSFTSNGPFAEAIKVIARTCVLGHTSAGQGEKRG